MWQHLTNLFSAQFMPHGHCYLWRPEVLWLHIGSDLIIALSYYSIPFCLVYLVRRRTDLAFNWIFLMFAAFIFLCGTTHLVDIWTTWSAQYGIEGIVKLFTALVSCATAYVLWRIMPQLLAVPSTQELKEAQASSRDSYLLLERQTKKTEEIDHLLKAILNHTPVLVLVRDLEGRTIFANQRYESIFGEDSDRNIGSTVSQEFFEEKISNILASKSAIEEVKVTELSDGPHTFTSTQFPILGADAEFVAVAGVATDITHLKKMEMALRESNVFLESVVEHIPNMIFMKDAKDLKFVLFNQAGENLLGIQRTEILGKSDYDLFPHEQADHFTTKDREVLASRQVLDTPEEPINTKFGARVLHTKKLALCDAKGEPAFLLGISEDITDQKQARDNLTKAHAELDERVRERTKELHLLNQQLQQRLTQLEEAEARFRVAVESAPNAMIMVGEKGTIKLVNAETERLFGYQRDELLGQSVEKLVPERFREVHPGLRNGFFSNPHARAMGAGRDLYGLRKDGSEFPIEIGLNPISTSEGPFVLSAIVDITSRKQAQQELKRSNQELEQFAYVASHDLKAPLRAIENLAEWIAADLGQNISTNTKENLELLQNRVRRMAGLLDALLQYSKIGRTKHERETVDIENLIEETVALLAPPASFTIRIISDLPVINSPLVPLEIIIRNLIGNAIKHCNRPDGCIEISACDQGQFIELIFADNGHGIPTEYKDKVFEMFQTLRPRDEVEGSGMGLALVKKTVETYGGRIVLDNDKGNGATFRVSWPKIAAI